MRRRLCTIARGSHHPLWKGQLETPILPIGKSIFVDSGFSSNNYAIYPKLLFCHFELCLQQIVIFHLLIVSQDVDRIVEPPKCHVSFTPFCRHFHFSYNQ